MKTPVPGISVVVARLPPCGLCERTPARFDCRTIYGPWAYLCRSCWPTYSLGRLGTGYGQELILDTAEGGEE